VSKGEGTSIAKLQQAKFKEHQVHVLEMEQTGVRVEYL